MSDIESEGHGTKGQEGISWQQRRLIDLHKLAPEFAHPTVEGLENLELISDGQPAIFVSTHHTENDMGLAIRTIGEHVPLIITDISTHDSPKGDVADKATFLAKKLLGRGTFLTISYQWEGDQKKPSVFHPEDFSTMANAMTETGKNVLIAAHNPKQDQATPGFGAAYLAMLTGAPLVPVASRVVSKESGSRVVIGQPFYLDSVDVQPFISVLEKRKLGEKPTPQDLIHFRSFMKRLREQGQFVFDQVEQLLSN